MIRSGPASNRQVDVGQSPEVTSETPEQFAVSRVRIRTPIGAIATVVAVIFRSCMALDSPVPGAVLPPRTYVRV